MKFLEPKVFLHFSTEKQLYAWLEKYELCLIQSIEGKFLGSVFIHSVEEKLNKNSLIDSVGANSITVTTILNLVKQNGNLKYRYVALQSYGFFKEENVRIQLGRNKKTITPKRIQKIQQEIFNKLNK